MEGSLESAVVVSNNEVYQNILPSRLEMRFEIFGIDRTDEQHRIEYDLDGKKDLITVSLWLRWGQVV